MTRKRRSFRVWVRDSVIEAVAETAIAILDFPLTLMKALT